VGVHAEMSPAVTMMTAIGSIRAVGRSRGGVVGRVAVIMTWSGVNGGPVDR
jgi:hypothetical protein